ncbi:alternative oxidase [Colletotrichum truncatum]|uniref:Alternative oxidase n=1 Tax=Colletotrichum truncatum TaxID=5467 RepID=A0ACC3YZQ8_COLTU|nr:alternative oxidase [Colletotrichum truncatum]KAF6790875.1 alternative oxidase [Colletotrichum truncatum]
MLCQGQPQVVISLAVALILVWSIRLLYTHEGISTLLYTFEEPSQQHVETVFIQQAMSVEFPAPIDYRPIQSTCAGTEFRPGLLFSCEGQHGGIGMVRDQILKCVRYAIHGGGALVIPSMQLRNASDISDIETNNEMPLDYLLDRQTFVTHLTEGCPGMRVYERAEDFPHYQQLAGQPLDLVGDQFEPNHPREGLEHPREWRRFFDEWLNQQSVRIRSDAPVHVKIGQAFLEYPVRDDGPAFVHEYGKILSFRNDTRELAAKVLFNLKQRFALPIDPTKAINPGAYFGAHLRLEDDAIAAWQPDEWRFSRKDDQFEEQFKYIENTGLNVVYVASGNQTVVKMFAEALAKRLAGNPNTEMRNVSVVTKNDLLQGPDRQLLDTLTFDQHALIDFLMLFKASAFMGVAHSSFPWTVALRRHEFSKYPTYGNEGSDLLKDEYSTIMGMAADYPEVEPFVYGLWP